MAKLPYALAIAGLLPLLFNPGSATAARVGVNSAVNQGATGIPLNAAAHRLIIGGNVLYQERIATGAKGQTQILFVDESTMSVGPNSNLVIDQFVYNPHTGGGKMVANLAHGIFRYVGGHLSKHDNAVQMKTSAATIGIRGGIVLVRVTRQQRVEVVFVFGKGVTVTGKNGVAKTITRPGYKITVARPGASPSDPAAAPSGTTEAFLAALDGRLGGTGGASVIPTDPMVVQSGIPATVSGNFQASVQASQTATAIQPPTGQVQPATSAPTYPPVWPGVATTPSRQAPPVPNPVVVQQNTNTSIASSQSQPTVVSAITGTASSSLPSTTPPPVAISYAGFYKTTPGTGSALGFISTATAFNIAYTGGQIGTGGYFTATLAGAPIRFPVKQGGGTLSFGATNTDSPYGPISGTSFLSSDGSFVYSDNTEIDYTNEHSFIFGGLPVSPTFFQPTGQTRFFAFNLQPDAALQSPIPFVRNAAGGNLANPTISPLYIVASPTVTFGGAPTFTSSSGTYTFMPTRALQASLAIDGQGSSQSSVIAMGVGAVEPLQGATQPTLIGAVRGSSLVSASGVPLSIGGSLGTIADPNQNSFFGVNAITGFVLDQSHQYTYGGTVIDSGAAETPLSGTPIDYAFTQPALATSLPAGVGASRTFLTAGLNGGTATDGYFGGLMNTTAQNQPYAITGQTIVIGNPSNNSLVATLYSTQAAGGLNSVQLAFGDFGQAGPHDAYIDDNIFGAAESDVIPAQVNGQNLPTGATKLYFLSSGVAPPPTALLPAGVSYCSCQYLKWGYWGGDITDAALARTDRAHINFWEAGSLTPGALSTGTTGDLDTLASQNFTGVYTGHMIGDVFNNGTQYIAAGGVQVTFNFASLSGSFAVNNYDGTSFTQAIPTQPGNFGLYNFAINQPRFSGTVNGQFYGPMAAETGGNFAWQNTAGPTYTTAGIFAARR